MSPPLLHGLALSLVSVSLQGCGDPDKPKGPDPVRVGKEDGKDYTELKHAVRDFREAMAQHKHDEDALRAAMERYNGLLKDQGKHPDPEDAALFDEAAMLLRGNKTSESEDVSEDGDEVTNANSGTEDVQVASVKVSPNSNDEQSKPDPLNEDARSQSGPNDQSEKKEEPVPGSNSENKEEGERKPGPSDGGEKEKPTREDEQTNEDDTSQTDTADNSSEIELEAGLRPVALILERVVQKSSSISDSQDHVMLKTSADGKLRRLRRHVRHPGHLSVQLSW